MNLLHEMILRNSKVEKACPSPTADLSAADKKKIEKIKKLDVQPSRKHPVYYKSIIKKSGPGGVIFDFGNATGNPVADRFTNLLNQFSEPGQVAITNFQNRQLNKSLEDYVAQGEHLYAANAMRRTQPDEYADKSTDDIIKAMAEKGELDCSEMGSGSGVRVTGEFNKSRMRLKGEELVGQSETDAAVIEMMKGMGLPTERQIGSMSDEDVQKLIRTPG